MTFPKYVQAGTRPRPSVYGRHRQKPSWRGPARSLWSGVRSQPL